MNIDLSDDTRSSMVLLKSLLLGLALYYIFRLNFEISLTGGVCFLMGRIPLAKK